jgi:hypothetical protein
VLKITKICSEFTKICIRVTVVSYFGICRNHL